MRKILFTTTLVALFLVMFKVCAFDIVKSGKAQACIVLPEKVEHMVKLACDELNYHLWKSTGTKLPVISEKDETEYKNLIYLGNTQTAVANGINPADYTGNDYCLKLKNNKLFIFANSPTPEKGIAHLFLPRGTLFGVYDLLENYLGVRWLWPGETGEYIPKHQSFSIDSIKATMPRVRNIRWSVTHRYSRKKDGSSLVSDKFIQDEKVFLRRQRMAQEYEYQTTHAFVNFWKRYHKKHLNFFQMLPNGKRGPLPGGENRCKYISMCVSQPELWKTIIKEFKERRPPLYWGWIPNRLETIHIGENDMPGLCTCQNCRSWDAKDPRFAKDPYWGKGIIPHHSNRFRDVIHLLGDNSQAPSLSDRYAKFFMKVLKEAKKINPKASVAGFAYANYVEPPVNTKLTPDVFISYTPAISYPWSRKKKERFEKNFGGWAATGAKMVYRPNYTHDGHNMPLLYGHIAMDNIKFALQNGMKQAYFDSLLGQWGTRAINFYWIQRTLIYPERSPDELLKEFCACFGKAEKSVEDYFRYLQKVSDSISGEKFNKFVKEEGVVVGFKNWLRISDKIFTPEVMIKAAGLLKQAATQVKNDQDALAKVKFLQDGLKHADLTLKARRLWRKYQSEQSAINRSNFSRSLKRLYAFRKKLSKSNSSNIDYLIYREHSTWDASFRLLPDEVVDLSEVWSFKWDKNKQGIKQKWFKKKNFSDWSKIEIGKFYHQTETGKKYLGKVLPEWGWHATAFNVPSSMNNKKVELIFGAVDESCDIWVNGELVLHRPFDIKKTPNQWKESFKIDITGQVKRGQKNILVVKVGNKYGAGGIWKLVHLTPGVVLADKNLIKNAGFEE